MILIIIIRQQPRSELNQPTRPATTPDERTGRQAIFTLSHVPFRSPADQ